MSEVRLVVREAQSDWSGTIHASWADRAIAALSADPVTIEELEVATERFAKPVPKRRFFANLSPGLDPEPYDAGLVVIDLVARLVVVDSTYSSPGPRGVVRYHDGRCCTETGLRYHLAGDWLFSSDGDDWKLVAEARRRERAAQPIRDARQVFYGRPLLVFVARECFALFARRDEIAAAVRAHWAARALKRLAVEARVALDQVDLTRLTDEEITPRTWPGEERSASPFYDSIKQIHAAWLLTPRDDLGGACPRQIALERHKHLMRDLHDRRVQWSLLGECPPGVAESSDAFRYGGFGTHELLTYHDLVRHLLWACWDHLAELAQSSTVWNRPETLTVGDFLATEVPRLESLLETCLDTPDLQHDGRTPRSIITRERARLPKGMSSHDALIDPDDYYCQMMDEMPGPAFWHLDGIGLVAEFAFDINYMSREQWERDIRLCEEHERQFDATRSERERLGITRPTPLEDDSSGPWSRSFSVGDAAYKPPGFPVFFVGCRLAELILGLRGGADPEATAPETQRLIDQINRDFGNLRELLQNSDSPLAEALIDPVLRRLAETLHIVATAHAGFALQCESITNGLHILLKPPPQEPDGDSREPEVPF